MNRLVLSTLAAVFVLTAAPAHALFGDDEARQAILELREQFKSQQEMQMKLYERVEQLSKEVQELRGQVEEMSNSLGKDRVNAKNLYGDLTNRLDQMDPKARAARAASDREIAANQEFGTCTGYFQKKETDKAIKCFADFGKKYSGTKLYADSLYWLGSGYYIKGNLAKAIETENKMANTYPKHAKAADALLIVGMAQMDQKKTAEAKNTFNSLIKRYPKSSAAKMAKDQL